MITRFNQDMDGSMYPEDDGQWVRFDDHEAENAAHIEKLEEQVAQANSRFEQIRITRNQLLEELTVLQSKSVALVDALNSIWTLCDGNAAKWAEEALAAFKGEK